MALAASAPRFFLYVGFAVATALLFKFALDFSLLANALVLSLWLLVAITVTVLATSVLAQPRDVRFTAVERLLLVAAIPLAFFASSLDCTGLEVRGCTAFCTFVKTIWIPLMALVCLVYYLTRRETYLFAIMPMSLVPLVPHCICYNPANGWWIDHLGASPQCYLWGFTVSLLSTSALLKGTRPWPTVATCYAIIGGALSFFVGHHFLGFPW